MRRTLLGLLTVIFTWGQVAAAFPKQDVAPLKSFLQKSEWTKRPVKVRELYELTKHTLPLEFRFEVERMLERQPNAELPKLDVRMIKNGQFEDVQLIAQRGKQAATATLSFRGNDVGRLTFSKDGKNYQKNLTYVDLFHPSRMMAQAYGPGTAVSGRIGFTRLLRKNDLALLRPADRLKYTAQVQEVMRIAERAQDAIADRVQDATTRKKGPAPKSKSGKKTTLNTYFDLLIEQAHANTGSPAVGSSCLVLGWIGKYEVAGGPCVPPKEAKDPAKCPGAYVCSKVLYGSNAQCGKITFEQGEATSTAEICNLRNSENRYDFFKGIKSQAEFDTRIDELSLKLNEIRALCATPKTEHLAECKDLENRMVELSAVNCHTLKAWRGQFTDLSCAGTAASVADAPAKPTATATATGTVTSAAANPNATGVDGAGSDVATPGADLAPLPVYQDGVTNAGTYETAPTQTQNLAPGIRCEGLPLSPSGLSCGGGNVASIACNTNNEARTHYYCICSSRNNDIYHNSAKPTSCKTAQPIVDDSPRPRTPDRVVRREPSWWDQNGGWVAMLGGLMTVGVGFLIYYNQQQQMKSYYSQYYEMYEPEVVTVAPPPEPVTGEVITQPDGVIVLPGTR